mgnify:CR=1 FL=1
MINEQLHRTPVALDRVKHRALKLDRTATDQSRLARRFYDEAAPLAAVVHLRADLGIAAGVAAGEVLSRRDAASLQGAEGGVQAITVCRAGP